MTDEISTAEIESIPDPRAEAIKTFIDTHFATPIEDRPSYGFDFDISAPRREDMNLIATGDYQIVQY